MSLHTRDLAIPPLSLIVVGARSLLLDSTAWTKLIPQCKGISGTTGALAIDLTYQYDEVDIPIDACVPDIARIADGGDKIGDQS